ncbi:MAG TPA: hypothetical protein VMT06_02980 [Candidatus Eisenbacteria bacterium]|nr:hypothetical protein [Candidatus Eisenbacteria bacterium]
MQRLKGRKAKFAIVVTVLVLIVVVLLFSGIDFNTARNPLTDAIESGESTLTAIDTNHQSMKDFTKDQQDEAKSLLKTAQVSQGQANKSLTYARRTSDEFVLSMAQNYALLLDSSEVMNQGVDHLLTVNDELQKALDDYWQGSYQAASDNASMCLQTLESLTGQFEQNNQTLEEINYRYLASGKKDQVKYAVAEFQDAMAIYLQYVQLLRTIKDGTAYLQEATKTNDLLDKLQHALANNKNQDAQQLLDELSKQLEQLKDPRFQSAASLASKIDPNLLNGPAQDAANDLKNQLKDAQNIQRFENYLSSVEKFNEASTYLANGEKDKAQQAADQGLAILAQGQDGSSGTGDIQRYSKALEFALNSLEMQIRGQPDQG